MQTEINSVITLYSNGQIQEALDSVEILVKDYPNEALLYNVSGACYAGLGQLDTAVKRYKQAIEMKPDYAEAHNNLGNAFRDLGQPDSALKSYKQALTIKPDFAEAHYNLAITQQGLNQLDTAVKHYEQALTIKPDYAEAFNNLGSVLNELGKPDTAVKSYEKILSIKPDYAEAHYNLALTLQELYQLDDAVKHYELAIEMKPDYAEAHNNLGIAHKELNQMDDAIKHYELAIEMKPDYAEAHYNLGIIQKDLGQLDAAINNLKKALTIKPNYTEAFNNLGNAFRDLGQLDDAIKSYEKALDIEPDFADAHYNLAFTQQGLNQLDTAVKHYEQAINMKPDYAEAHNNLGNAFRDLGQPDSALKSYKQALTIKPDFAEAHNNLGNALKDLGQLDDAIKSYEQALDIEPDSAEAHNNLGIALMIFGQLDGALKSYEKALAIKPDYADAHHNFGVTLEILGQVDKALASYKHAIALKPDINFILGILLHAEMHLCIWDDLTNRLNELTDKINNGEKVLSPFASLALIDEPEIHRKTAEIYAKEMHPQSHFLPKIERYPKHKKIRVGYFSADFRDHPVSHLTAELYETHDRNQFEIYAFSFGFETKDEMNLRIKAGVDHFHDVRTMSHKDVATLARSIELDIAVDLGGYTQGSRTGIFAMTAAPIQISYIGYLGTMGINYYDYLLADQTIIPEKNQKYYSEKIVYLPSFQVNDSKQSPPTTIFTRQDFGLPKIGFVFCCFNNTYKITPTTFDSWGRILEQVDDSVLLIYIKNESAKINLTKEIVLRDIDPKRLIFGKRLPKPEYLARYRVANLFLDTLPYNAGTTASDALRMGLPVLTCMGNSYASRMAASLLNALNLQELITTTQEQYESLAIELATNPEKLKIIKDKLVHNLPTAPLYDTSLFTRHLESAYLTMYDRYQNGLDPDHIYVKEYK